RDPIERFFSQYWFNRNAAIQSGTGSRNLVQLQDPQVLAAQHCSLEEYLRRQATAIVRSYTNVQSAHFAQRFCADPYDLPEEGFIEAAVAGLREYDLVGVFDDLRGFLDVVCDDLSLPSAV